MTRLTATVWFLAGLVCSCLLGTAAVSQAAALPDPADEAALYAAAKVEATLVWYTTGPVDSMVLISNQFEKKYPGVKVQVQRVTGTLGTRRFMQESQAKQYIADAVDTSDRAGLMDMIQAGYLAKWRVPTADRLPASAQIKDFAFSPVITSICIIYNSSKVTPEEAAILASGWKGILDPRFKGRFSVTNSNTGASYGPINMFLDPKLKDQFGPEFLKQVMAQKPVLYNDNPVAYDRVVAGENDIQLLGWEALANSKWNQGAPIRWVFPPPTPVFSNEWKAVSAFAPHPNAARLFQNWLLSEDGARAAEGQYGSRSVLSGFADTRKVAQESWYKPPTQTYAVDMDRWEANSDKEMATWHKIQQDAR